MIEVSQLKATPALSIHFKKTQFLEAQCIFKFRYTGLFALRYLKPHKVKKSKIPIFIDKLMRLSKVFFQARHLFHKENRPPWNKFISAHATYAALLEEGKDHHVYQSISIKILLKNDSKARQREVVNNFNRIWLASPFYQFYNSSTCWSICIVWNSRIKQRDW